MTEHHSLKTANALSHGQEVFSSIPWRAYLELCKPKVVLLMILTALVGMCLASPTLVPVSVLIFGLGGIALCAGSAAVINQLIDRKIDALMDRTEKRPIPSKQISPRHAFIFALGLGIVGMGILIVFINVLTALLTFFTLIAYAIIYTVFLKHATPQNIVIGGFAGAMPPLLGWTAVTGQFDPYSLLLVLIIFTWTPPHFWALAIYRHKEYSKAKVPMLPITHGIAFTKFNIILYTILLLISSLLPYLTGMSGLIYLISVMVLNGIFLYYAIRLKYTHQEKFALKTFIYSIYYLMFLFVFLLVDHYIRIQII